MRRSILALLVLAAAAVPAAAQFEGTITMKISNIGPTADEMMMKMAVKGDMQATILTMPASAGPMAGMEMRIVVDPKTHLATSLIPLPPQMQAMPAFANAKGMKTVVDLSKIEAGSADDKIDVRKLGTTEKIAGFDCENFEITSSQSKPVRACISQSLGRFTFPDLGAGMGGMGRRGGPSPSWAKAFGDRPGFPLKVWGPDGAVAMEVTSVDRAAVSASLFEIPEDYLDMSAMFKGRGGF